MNSFFALFLFLSPLFCAPCEPKDFGISYGACSNGKRDVVFYLKNDCEQTTNKLPDPPVLQNINCTGVCPSQNSIFNMSKSCPGNPSGCCSSCPEGYEPDGGEYLYAEWDSQKGFPSNFYSSTWRVDDVGITTGPVRPNTTSILDIEVDVLNSDVQRSFLYFESIAYYTGYGSSFQFMVDGKPYPNDTAAVLSLGSWTYKYVYNLPYGSHNLSFVYRSNEQNTSSSIEGARISYILLSGMQHDSTICKPCSAGQGSTPSTRCSYCSINYYTKTDGEGTCKPCDDDEYSLSGATKCAPKAPCTLDDYHISYSKCVDGSVTKTYDRYYPYICDDDPPPSGLQNNTKVPCQQCNPGLYLVNDVCVPCPSGSFREKLTDDDTVCTPCPNGTTSVKSSYYRTIDFEGTERGLFTTHCHALLISYADCSSGGDGWTSYNNTLTSGNHYTGAVSTTLVAHIPGSYGATIDFSFTLHLHQNSSFVYYAGPNGIPTYYNSSSNDKLINVSLPYTQANFTWTFHKHQKRAYNNDTGVRVSDYVEMDHIIFHDIRNATGGGTMCKACPDGTISGSGESTCSWCEAGTFSHSGDAACTPCTNNTYTNGPRAAECLPCGEQNRATHIGDGNATLNNTCTITDCGVRLNSTHVFDLRPLVLNERQPRLGAASPSAQESEPEDLGAGEGEGEASNDTMYGPIEVPGYMVGTFYIGICHSLRSEAYCKTAQSKMNTKFCEVWGENDVFDVGNKTNITYFENFDTGDYGINITYYDGSYYYRWDQIDYEGDRSAEVLFVCKVGAGVGKIQKNRTVDFVGKPHKYHFRWETEYACRLCQPEDYEPFKGECYDSKIVTTYVPKAASRCSHGAVPPPDEVEKCTMPVATMNGGGLAFIIIAAVAVAVVVVVILAILIRKNRKLQYQLVQKDILSTGGASSGMGGAEGMVSFDKK